MKITFDEGAFRREIEKQMQGALTDVSRTLERDLNGLSRSMKGQPLAETKARVKRTFESDGGSITDPELTEYAEAVQAGTNFHVNTGRLRL